MIIMPILSTTFGTKVEHVSNLDACPMYCNPNGAFSEIGPNMNCENSCVMKVNLLLTKIYFLFTN